MPLDDKVVKVNSAVKRFNNAKILNVAFKVELESSQYGECIRLVFNEDTTPEYHESVAQWLLSLGIGSNSSPGATKKTDGGVIRLSLEDCVKFIKASWSVYRPSSRLSDSESDSETEAPTVAKPSLLPLLGGPVSLLSLEKNDKLDLLINLSVLQMLKIILPEYKWQFGLSSGGLQGYDFEGITYDMEGKDIGKDGIQLMCGPALIYAESDVLQFIKVYCQKQGWEADKIVEMLQAQAPQVAEPPKDSPPQQKAAAISSDDEIGKNAQIEPIETQFVDRVKQRIAIDCVYKFDSFYQPKGTLTFQLNNVEDLTSLIEFLKDYGAGRHESSDNVLIISIENVRKFIDNTKATGASAASDLGLRQFLKLDEEEQQGQQPDAAPVAQAESVAGVNPARPKLPILDEYVRPKPSEPKSESKKKTSGWIKGLSIFLGVVGAAALSAGIALTLTGIGAAFGLPLLVAGSVLSGLSLATATITIAKISDVNSENNSPINVAQAKSTSDEDPTKLSPPSSQIICAAPTAVLKPGSPSSPLPPASPPRQIAHQAELADQSLSPQEGPPPPPSGEWGAGFFSAPKAEPTPPPQQDSSTQVYSSSPNRPPDYF